MWRAHHYGHSARDIVQAHSASGKEDFLLSPLAYLLFDFPAADTLACPIDGLRSDRIENDASECKCETKALR